MTDDNDALLDAATALVPPLLNALEALAFAGRHLHPPHLPRIAAALEPFEAPVREGRARFDAVKWPDDLQFFRSQLVLSSDATLRALDGVAQSATDPNGVMRAYRSMRSSTQAVEALYPLSFMLPPVSRFFLEPERRQDDALGASHRGRRCDARRRRHSERRQRARCARRLLAVRAGVLRRVDDAGR